MNKLFVLASSISLTLLLGGCETLPDKTQSTSNISTSPATNAEHIQDAEASPLKQYSPFPTETLYSLLVAEVAASRQAFDVTSSHYIEQAKLTNDKGIIARAARITQFFRNHQDSLDMGLLWLKQEPDNIEAITIVANAYLELNQPLIALDYTENLLEQLHASSHTTSDGGAFLETIANLSKRADTQTLNTLIERFKGLTKQYPDLSGIKVGLSVLHQRLGNDALAHHWVMEALKQEPHRNSAITQDILVLQQQNKTELAISKLKELLEKNPSNHHLRLLYARILTSNNYLEEGYEQFSILAEQSPQQLDLQFSKGILALELNKILEAGSIFEKLQNSNYRSDTVGFYLGRIAESQGKMGSAINAYMSVNSGENYLPSRNRIARIHIQQGQIKAAQDLYRELRSAHPKKQEQLYVIESSLLVQAQLDDIALTLLNTAISLYPDNSDLRYNRATLYERQNNLEGMEQDFKHTLSIDPNNIVALNGLGYFLTIRTNRYQDAYTFIKRALTLKPNDPAIMDSMGWVKFKLGQTTEAIELLEKAYRLLPDAEVAAHLAEALWSIGQQEKAKKVLNNALEKEPNAPEITNIIQRLNISL